MNTIDIIRTKRDGGALSDEQVRFFIDGYTAGRIPDEQAAALLMAIVFRGMEPRELATWTEAMTGSGERIDLSRLSRPTVDKHSTGGVGDKVSLVLTPLVAACGAAVPQLAGRGLGHTGGTLDKLEAIPGWRAQLDSFELLHQLETVGGAICATGEHLVPADRKLYALRDVTATVESIPLIASSIMSKKLAEGTASLVIDVKAGSGAFLPGMDQARELALTLCGIGRANGVRTVALVTDMDTPLGHAVGNGIEVAEAVEMLAGGGPGDLAEVTLALAHEMCELAGLALDPHDVLDSGRAMDKWRDMIRAQGGDPLAPLPRANERERLSAPASGYVRRIDARAVGNAAWRLGAGRARKEDRVSPAAGVQLLAKPGDRVRAGDPLLELLCDDPARIPDAIEALAGAIEIGDDAPPRRRLVHERVDPASDGSG